jgi:hypothetical protein
MCIVLVISVDVSTICLVLHSYMIKYQYVHVMLMIYSWINIIEKLPRFLTRDTTKKRKGLLSQRQRACLVHTQASHANTRARQNFGERIVHPCLASAWTQKQA